MIKNIIKYKLLKSLEKIHHGKLTLTTPTGEVYTFQGKEKGVHADIKLNSWVTAFSFMLSSDIGLAKSYRDNLWQSKNLMNLLKFGYDNAESFALKKPNRFFALYEKIKYSQKANTIKQSKHNIQAHYDLSNDFFALWLDPSMTYSSALFEKTQDLYLGQQNKYNNILDKLPNTGRVLEVGCGWGGFIESALSQRDYTIKGISISPSQCDYARQRLTKFGGNAQVDLEDYREQQGQYDAIVSIEMLEAVGMQYWELYFKKLKSLLRKKGKIVIQTILIKDERFLSYTKTPDFIRSMIFPGGMLPSMNEITQLLSKLQLKITDQFFFPEDYAKTLLLWEKRFLEQSEKLNHLGFDPAFQRLWQFYLLACAASFQSNNTTVCQLVISHA